MKIAVKFQKKFQTTILTGFLEKSLSTNVWMDFNFKIHPVHMKFTASFQNRGLAGNIYLIQNSLAQLYKFLVDFT